MELKVLFPPEPEAHPFPKLTFKARLSNVNEWVGAKICRVAWFACQAALLGLLTYGSYWVTSKYIYENVGVVGVSMFPTLQNNHHYLLNRWTYLFREPHPADIVVLRDPSDNGYAVKRIIGTAGDCIYIKNGRVYLNGRLLSEPYLEPGTATYASLTKEGNQWLICGTNQFFVMGDNRNYSIDSRIYGAVSRENILGTVVR